MKSSQMKVSDIGEKGLIERIIERSKTCSDCRLDSSDNFSDFTTSIGDDSALTNVKIDDNSYLVSSSDMIIQSSHFPYDMTYFQMGYKAVVVNVSDLASMGAENIGIILDKMGIRFTGNLSCILMVVGAAIKFYAIEYMSTEGTTLINIPLIGGDTNQANEIIISGTAIGQVDKDKALMKYGFETGDLVCISGELGLAALGFELLNLKKLLNNNLFEMVDIEEKLQKVYEIDSSLCDLAIFKALKVEARYDEGRILRDYNTKENRVSATDITDGLASEFYEILNSDKKYCQFNNKTQDNNLAIESYNNDSEIPYSKGIRIYEDKLPVEDEFKEIANVLGINYLDLFLHVGEDFELLFTINKEMKDQLSSDMNYYVIGEITDSFTVEIVLSNGTIEKISSKGYQHLK